MARYYDGSAARFCSADPVGGRPGDPQSWNRYAYVGNDPIDRTDPSGKSFLDGLFNILGKVMNWLGMEGSGGFFQPVATGTPPTFPGDNGPLITPGELQDAWKYSTPPFLDPATAPTYSDLEPAGGGVGTGDSPQPVPPQNPCFVTQGLHTAQNAVDIRTPGGYGSSIPAPESGSIIAANWLGWRVEPPFDMTQAAPAGSTNFVQFQTTSDYTVTYYHTQPLGTYFLSDRAYNAGDPIAFTDDSGRQTAPHVHVTVQYPSGGYMDPRVYFPDCQP